jgi:hypothetical protein
MQNGASPITPTKEKALSLHKIQSFLPKYKPGIELSLQEATLQLFSPL